LIALIIGPWFSVISARDRAAIRDNTPRRVSSLIQQTIFSDLDGDSLADVAELSTDGPFKNIHVSFSSAPATNLSFDSKVYDRGKLISSDIDHDNDQDLIWYSPDNPDLIVFWINDGRGRFGPATSYQQIQQQDFDLSAVFNNNTDSLFNDKYQQHQVTRAAHTLELFGNERRECVCFSPELLSLHSNPFVLSPSARSVRKRGPPRLT